MTFFATLEAKIVAAIVVFVLIVGGAWYFHHAAYKAGEKAIAPKIQAQIDASNAKQVAIATKTFNDTSLNVGKIDYAAQMQAKTIIVTRTVYLKSAEAAASANPSFAVSHIPPAYSSLRASRHAALTAAADRSAQAAGRSAPAVSGTSP